MMNLSLGKVLDVHPSSCIAFVGAGGKSTAMFNLAKELSRPVIVTATTHLGTWQIPLADSHIHTNDSTITKQITSTLHSDVTLITGEFEGDRTKPVNDKLLAWLHSFCRSHAIPLLIESDGARQKSLKAWADHEPPIPPFVDHVVQVTGMNGIGKPLIEENVHRAEIFSKLSELDIGDSITTKALIQVLTNENGGMKNIPSEAKRSVMLNQADTSERQSIARAMKDALLPYYHSVVIASLKNKSIHAVHESIAGIILAAGEASRFGSPKQLLKWRAEPFVRVVSQTALRAGLSPVVVVTGAHAEQVEAAVHDLNVRIVRNENWKTGQGSSIREGVRSLPDMCGGAIFLLADQPQVGTSILHALKEKHAEGLYPIIPPMIFDRRANPVLFDRVTFPDLMDIEGDMGGRAVFHKHRVEYLPWHDENLLLDVDTPEQYQRLISNKNL